MTADFVRGLERSRIRALVRADMSTAHLMHTRDFQLITPGGTLVTREEYLGDLTVGRLRYVSWEPGTEMTIRVYRDAAVLQYRARVEIRATSQTAWQGLGDSGMPFDCWFMNVYEQRDDRWQAAQSQATEIRYV